MRGKTPLTFAFLKTVKVEFLRHGHRQESADFPQGIRPHFLFETSKRKRPRPVKGKNVWRKFGIKDAYLLKMQGDSE